MDLPNNIPHLLSEADTATKLFLDDSNNHFDEQKRKKAARAVDLLSTALKTPEERILHHSFDVSPLNMCVRLAVDMRLFHILSNMESFVVSLAELANIVGGDGPLIVRVMRILTVAGYAAEVKKEVYAATPISKAMTSPAMEACVIHRYDIGVPALIKAPKFFKSHRYRASGNTKDTPFQAAFSTDLHFYEYLEKDPDTASNFQSYMRSFQLRSPRWIDWFPVRERILNGYADCNGTVEPKNALMVDVGGGKGQYIRQFHQAFSNTPGRLILEDRPTILQQVRHQDVDIDPIELMAYDFFTPQIVRGARVYYFHNIFTNWSDDECSQILGNTVSAMTPGYSKLILNEVVLPDKGCSWQHAALDITMMTSFSGLLRTEERWHSLLTSSGLQQIIFWYPPDGADGVIEALRGEVDLTIRNPTYHATDAEYALPNDSYEHRRLEDQAAGLDEMMHGKITHVPLDNPAILVEIGCGTGIQTCKFATTYPNAQVYGIDLSAVPDRHKPPNVEFIQGDVRKLVTKDPRLDEKSTDYVFSRLLILGMTEWQSYVSDVVSLLRPGGWAEMQDLDLDWYLMGERCSDTWPWLVALRKQAVKKGWDLNCGSNIKAYMEKAGLVDVQQKRYRLPYGAWMVSEKPETERIGKHSAREYGMLYHYAIPKMLEGAGYSDEDIRKFQAQSKTADSGLGAFNGKEMGFYVTVGMKPKE